MTKSRRFQLLETCRHSDRRSGSAPQWVKWRHRGRRGRATALLREQLRTPWRRPRACLAWRLRSLHRTSRRRAWRRRAARPAHSATRSRCRSSFSSPSCRQSWRRRQAAARRCFWRRAPAVAAASSAAAAITGAMMTTVSAAPCTRRLEHLRPHCHVLRSFGDTPCQRSHASLSAGLVAPFLVPRSTLADECPSKHRR